MRRRLGSLALVVGASLAGGCAPWVHTVSVPPPSRVGTLWVKTRDGEDTLRVGKGVALAIECRDVWSGGPCDDARASTRDPKIARVLPAHLAKTKSPWLDHAYADENVSHRSVFVIAGVEEGETELTLTSESGNRTFLVSVER